MNKSIVTDFNNYSVFSGSPKECDHHLIYGTGLHELADEDHLTIPLLNREHNLSPKGTIYQIHGNPAAEKLSKIAGQLAWERQYLINKYQLPFDDLGDEAREAFRNRYGRSYL
jgi:hypothetical protein